jgi:hypothetical protein
MLQRSAIVPNKVRSIGHAARPSILIGYLIFAENDLMSPLQGTSKAHSPPPVRMWPLIKGSRPIFGCHLPVLKRSIGCAQIGNATSYETEGSTFEIFCDFVWHASNTMTVTYTIDFVSCMDACIGWNGNHSAKCVGVVWRGGYYGPGGEAGGSICSLQWNMIVSEGYNQTSFDSARLLSVPLPPVRLPSLGNSDR